MSPKAQNLLDQDPQMGLNPASERDDEPVPTYESTLEMGGVSSNLAGSSNVANASAQAESGNPAAAAKNDKPAILHDPNSQGAIGDVGSSYAAPQTVIVLQPCQPIPQTHFTTHHQVPHIQEPLSNLRRGPPALKRFWKAFFLSFLIYIAFSISFNTVSHNAVRDGRRGRRPNDHGWNRGGEHSFPPSSDDRSDWLSIEHSGDRLNFQISK
ncbi:hypothetical protein IE53DRAFT_365504 [Violaceomyces palustris]|uniref:Uncharacterized protein n=1 Tax=Violaceomyces palustris TaxID=1673888 RepID=A0ACD0P8A9_9BASI|nr:hypothetical protein IE53DRAFT_365504 [Violaceomyces palustris]